VGNLSAAFHHAGHAVAAHLSKYHVVAMPLRLDAYGTGEIVAALSRRKLAAAEKIPSDAARADPDVAASIAVILCAGLASEEIAASRALPLIPDPRRSVGDFGAAASELIHAGIADGTQPYKDAATTLLTQQWRDVERVAEHLLSLGELAPEAIAQLIDSHIVGS
jgi:hypothetical protein